MLLLRVLYLCMFFVPLVGVYDQSYHKYLHGSDVSTVKTLNKLHVRLKDTLHQFGIGTHVYNYNAMGETIQFICKDPGGNSALQWKDNYGFGSDKYDTDELWLKIKTDSDDHNLKLNCTNGYSNITIRLHISDAQAVYNHQFTGPETMLIDKGHHFDNRANCNSIIKPPNASEYIIRPNQTIIQYFDKKDDGTIVTCVTYHVTVLRRPKNVYTVERQKDVKLLCLNETADAVKQNEKKIERNQGSGNTLAVVGGILGTIIFMLCAIIFVIWFKKTRRPSSDDTLVIYAEIQDRPPQLPPPRQRAEQPYAIIMGTLIPKEETTSTDASHPTIHP